MANQPLPVIETASSGRNMTDEGPRIASPAGFEPVDDENKEAKKPFLSSLIQFDKQSAGQVEPFSHRESMTSNANRSDKGKRA